MKTIQENNFKTLNASEMNEVKGGYYVIITLPNGRIIRVQV